MRSFYPILSSLFPLLLLSALSTTAHPILSTINLERARPVSLYPRVVGDTAGTNYDAIRDSTTPSSARSGGSGTSTRGPDRTVFDPVRDTATVRPASLLAGASSGNGAKTSSTSGPHPHNLNWGARDGSAVPASTIEQLGHMAVRKPASGEHSTAHRLGPSSRGERAPSARSEERTGGRQARVRKDAGSSESFQALIERFIKQSEEAALRSERRRRLSQPPKVMKQSLAALSREARKAYNEAILVVKTLSKTYPTQYAQFMKEPRYTKAVKELQTAQQNLGLKSDTILIPASDRCSYNEI